MLLEPVCCKKRQKKVPDQLKYRGLISCVTSPALGSDDLSLDQSGTSIQILPEPNAGHMTRFLWNYDFTKFLWPS